MEFIHLRYAFKDARNATVSSASTLKTRVRSSILKSVLARVVAGLLTSGFNELRTVCNFFSEENFKRTFAFVFAAMAPNLLINVKMAVEQKSDREQLGGFWRFPGCFHRFFGGYSLG
jgi:hypothetical protein